MANTSRSPETSQPVTLDEASEMPADEEAEAGDESGPEDEPVEMVAEKPGAVQAPRIERLESAVVEAVRDEAPPVVARLEQRVEVVRESTRDPLEPVDTLDVEDGFAAVDRLLDRMQMGNAVFTPPRKMKFGERRIVELVVGTEDISVEDLKAEINKSSTPTETRQLRVSEEMRATLTGEGFSIEAITDEVQPVSRREPTKWEWQITPTKYGDQVLHLAVHAVLTVEGKEPRNRSIKTFQEDIEVEITMVQLAQLFVVAHWQWFCASILLPIGFWWVKNRKKLSADSAD